MRSTVLTHVSALLLALGGVALLFAPVELLAHLAPDAPSSIAWIVQLLAAAWLGLAAMNWMARFTMLGGIYGRGVVLANFTAYFTSAMSLLHVLRGGVLSTTALVLTGITTVMAAAYTYLLLVGPFPADQVPATEG